MSSHLLLEGILDVKDPRGSEDRKFWKPWRRVWIRFSVVHPPGRGVEPYLLLNFSHNVSEAPEKEIRISRDGLRLFRCRSKSRPYQTWAMASGNKVILYFAAGSEMQGQNCMQSVRDGLWPPCFSFQMLTACSQEVSLIDDDNTFMSGLLGVYGRFVLTSDDIISLVHPHWGATSLEISLSNIKDVLFVREADMAPAGVFSIVLKRQEGKKVKALQFFCHKAKETIQWILSKMYTKSAKESLETLENKASTAKKVVSPKSDKQVNPEKENQESLNVNPCISIKKTDEAQNSTNQAAENEDTEYLSKNPTLTAAEFTGQNKTANIVPEYENIQNINTISISNTTEPTRINVNCISNSDEYGKVNKTSRTANESENIFNQESTANNRSTVTKDTIENKPSDIKSKDNIYANIVPATDFAAVKSFSSSESISDNTSNEYENIKRLNETEAPLTLHSNISETAMYSTVNKNNASKESCHKTLNAQFSTSQLPAHNSSNTNQNMLPTNIQTNGNYSTTSSKENCKSAEINSNFSRNVTRDLPTANRIENGIKVQQNDSFLKDNTIIFSPNPQLYSRINKSIRRESDDHSETVQSSIKDSLNDYRNTKMDNSRLPNLPSEFLDTSMNFIAPRDKMTSGSSSSEDDTDILKLLTEEFSDSNSSERLYEDILDRKGTVYEEIDESDYERSPKYLPPKLPIRPENLEIPDSLRLQKLSKSINQILKMDSTDLTTKEFPRTRFIKKIKDTSRIMQISPNQEHAKESFAIETKLPVNSKDMLACAITINSNTPPQ